MKNAQVLHFGATTEINNKPSRIKLKSEIIFGSPSTGCKGSGVCKVVPASIPVQDWKCPHALAWIYLLDNAKIRFEFIRSSMSEQQYKRYFRWQLFQVYEPYPMPIFIEKKLKVKQNLIVLPGIYPVIETPHVLIVDF